MGPGLPAASLEQRVGSRESLYDRTALPTVPQCRELYYCVKDSMERAAARQQSIKPGEQRTAPWARAFSWFSAVLSGGGPTRRSGRGTPHLPAS